MKCIMCNKSKGQSGSIIKGIASNYKICADCLDKYVTDLKIDKNPNYTERQNKIYVTRQKIGYIQKQVDNKLNQFLLD